MEKYLLRHMSYKERISLTKLRLSNHPLMIDTGRHLKLDILQRYCPFCPNIIETEQHFLLHCEIYSVVREVLLQEISLDFPLFNLLCEKDKFIALMTNEGFMPLTARFTHKAFEIRSFLINQPKNHE